MGHDETCRAGCVWPFNGDGESVDRMSLPWEGQ